MSNPDEIISIQPNFISAFRIIDVIHTNANVKSVNLAIIGMQLYRLYRREWHQILIQFRQNELAIVSNQS